MIVAFAYSPMDQELAVKSSQWLVELGKNQGHRALIIRDVRCNPNYDREIEYNLRQVFDSTETTSVVEQIDGWPQAPNIVFRTTARYIQFNKPEPWLFLEADCVVLKGGWVESLWKEYQQALKEGKAFLSDFVNVPDVIPHASGISVYPGVMVDHAPNALFADDIAWDCFAADQIVPRMKQTALIKHRWKHPPLNNQSEVDNLLGQLGDAVLFHADKSGTLINFLRERKNGIRTGPPLIELVQATGPLVTDIFIKTYPKDYEWLGYCLRSIDKFCSGFREVKVLYDAPHDPPWRKDEWRPKNFELKTKGLEPYGNDGYLSQQVFKLYADTLTDADWILATDSDTIFARPVTPDTYLKNGKPVWMITPMKDAHPNQQNSWAWVMQKFMGKEPQFEYMRRHPTMVPRWALDALREFCLKQHGVELKDYIMSQPYREFSEWNVLGFFLHEYHHDKFDWFDTSLHPENEWPVLTVDQRWSHNPIPKEEWEAILSGGVKCEDKGTPKQPVPLQAGEESPSPARSMPADSGQKGVEQLPPSSNDPRAEVATTSGTRLSPIEEVARMFTSPLAKGRIIKRLKAAPIIK